MPALEPSPQVLRLQRQLDAAQRISQALFQHHSLAELVEKALVLALDIADAETGAILLANSDTKQLEFHYSIGHQVAPGTAVPWTAGIAGAVFQSGLPEIVHDVKQDARHFPGIDAQEGFHTRNLIALPLKQWEGRPVGVLEIVNKRHGSWEEDDLLILNVISAFTALAIEQNRLLEKGKLEAMVQLLQAVLHDIHNMLTPVVMGASDIEESLNGLFKRLANVDSTQTEITRDHCEKFFSIMNNSLRRVRERGRHILHCLKGEIAPPQFTMCSLHAIMQSVLRVLGGIAAKQGITIVTEGLERLPTFRADETLLYNAFYNLINNAIPEVPVGGTITVRGEVDLSAGLLNIAVSDTGRGMPAEVRDSLFSSRTISRKAGGTGLGTKIVKDVIDAHCGRISVESAENIGTTFHLHLPLSTPVADVGPGV